MCKLIRVDRVSNVVSIHLYKLTNTQKHLPFEWVHECPPFSQIRVRLLCNHGSVLIEEWVRKVSHLFT